MRLALARATALYGALTLTAEPRCAGFVRPVTIAGALAFEEATKLATQMRKKQGLRRDLVERRIVRIEIAALLQACLFRHNPSFADQRFSMPTVNADIVTRMLVWASTRLSFRRADAHMHAHDLVSGFDGLIEFVQLFGRLREHGLP